MKPWLVALCSACLMLGLPGQAFPQADEAARDPWSILRPLAGHWKGDIGGDLGSGEAVRSYEFILDGRFLLLTHASVRLPQPESPEGDHHREMGIYSYDAARDAIVYRQFVVEGFVLEYACSADPDERRVTCSTERIENGEGMSARETLHLLSDHEFVETFELLAPDGDLVVRLENRWTRVPRLD